MNIQLYTCIIIIFILFYISDHYIFNNNEHFINIYQYMNQKLEKEPKKNTTDFTINRNFKKFNDLYLKNIYLSYYKKSECFDVYMFNYEHKLFMKIKINKDQNNFDITDSDNNNLGTLIKRYHNKYYINLQKLYKNDYIFLIKNNYNEIKIFCDFEYNIFYLKKFDSSNKKYKLYLFEDEIGYIKNDNSHFKFYIKKKYLEKINLFAYALTILIINNKT